MVLGAVYWSPATNRRREPVVGGGSSKPPSRTIVPTIGRIPRQWALGFTESPSSRAFAGNAVRRGFSLAMVQRTHNHDRLTGKMLNALAEISESERVGTVSTSVTNTLFWLSRLTQREPRASYLQTTVALEPQYLVTPTVSCSHLRSTRLPESDSKANNALTDRSAA